MESLSTSSTVRAARSPEAADTLDRQGRPTSPRFVAGVARPHTARLALARSRTTRPFARHLRRAARRLRRAGARPVDGGVDLLLVETDLRHAQRQGRARRASTGAGDGRRAAADDLGARSPMLRAARSPARPSTPSGLGRHASPVGRRQLRAGRREMRPYVAELAAVADCSSSATPTPACPTPLASTTRRPETTGALRRVRRERLGQHRRRLLRHDARSHRGDRRGGRRRRAARAGSAGQCRFSGLEPLVVARTTELLNDRRAHQRHRLRPFRKLIRRTTTTPRSKSRATRCERRRRSSTSTWTRACSTRGGDDAPSST